MASVLFFGALAFVWSGCALEMKSPGLAGDFKASYYSGRCFIHLNCDPYAQNDVLRTFEAGEHVDPASSDASRFVVTRYVYLPSAFVFTHSVCIAPTDSCTHRLDGHKRVLPYSRCAPNVDFRLEVCPFIIRCSAEVFCLPIVPCS